MQQKIITYGYFVRAHIPKTQIREVLNRFDLHHLVMPMTRCTRCNGKLAETDKQKTAHRLKPLTKKYFDQFLICSDCEQIYW
ncbi:MAG: Mut7-C RNAse domain-containing protein [Betaproteobacteria bacterium]|nr:Mut7-C RNAse domain-containing protein [Betaproteobacteria bacterium]